MADPLDGIPAHLRGQVHADQYGYWAGRLTVQEREQFIAGLQATYDAAQLEALHRLLPKPKPELTIGEILNLQQPEVNPDTS